MEALIVPYIMVMVISGFTSINLFLEDKNRKYGARVLLLTPVWPVWSVVFAFYLVKWILLGIRGLFRMAEWVPKKREKPLTIFDPMDGLPTEADQKPAPGRGTPQPMTERPKAPKKGI